MARIRYVLNLALPSAGEQLLSMLVGIVDTFLVGHLGAAPLTAVGLANQWVLMVMVFFGAIGTGSTALIARMVGSRDPFTANKVLRQSMLIALLTGVLVTLPMTIWAEPAMRIMGAEAEAIQLGATYLRIAGMAFILSSLMFVGNACLRGAGDTRTPLRVMVVVNVLNTAIAWALINGTFGLPRLGVAGSAYGALVGRLVGGLVVLGVLLKGRGGLQLNVKGFRVDVELIQRILKVGLPTGLEQLIFRFGMMSYARVVASLGTTAYAAHQVALNGESLSYMPGFGFAVAATTLVGQSLGARDPRKAAGDGYIAFGIGGGLMALMGVIFFLFAAPIVGFFTDDPAVIALGTPPLRLVGVAQPFLAATMILAGGLRGAGDTRAPMWINGISVWIVRVPLALLFTQVLGWGLTGAWVAMCVDLGIRGSLIFLRFRTGKWKNIEV